MRSFAASPRSHVNSLRALLRREEPGAAPGTLTVQPTARPETHIRVMAYGKDDLFEGDVERPGELRVLLDRWPVVWIDVDGLGNLTKIDAIGQLCGLHPLALEDAVRGSQRPKLELYPDHLFVVLRMLSLAECVKTEQLALFLTRNAVITLQGERPGDCLGPVREHLRAGDPRIRAKAADYLAYAIIDATVDCYFPLLDAYGERLEVLEEDVTTHTRKADAARIQSAKHDLFTVRRAVWPTRDALAVASRDENQFVRRETRLYLRDVLDHITQLSDILDTYREVTSGLMDVHLSSTSNRLNEIMKVLTLVSVVFIPMNFVAGVYGMNFDPTRSPFNMPELGWRFGYLWALGLMFVCAAVLVVYFRKKGFFD